jgi:hypothetical protein
MSMCVFGRCFGTFSYGPWSPIGSFGVGPRTASTPCAPPTEHTLSDGLPWLGQWSSGVRRYHRRSNISSGSPCMDASGLPSGGSDTAFNQMLPTPCVISWTRRLTTSFAPMSLRGRFGHGSCLRCTHPPCHRSRIPCYSPGGCQAGLRSRRPCGGALTHWSCSSPGFSGRKGTVAHSTASPDRRPSCCRLSSRRRTLDRRGVP